MHLSSHCRLGNIYWMPNSSDTWREEGGGLGMIPTCIGITCVHSVWNLGGCSITTANGSLQKLAQREVQTRRTVEECG